MQTNSDNNIYKRALKELEKQCQSLLVSEDVFIFNGYKIKILVSNPFDLFKDGPIGDLQIDGIALVSIPKNDGSDIYVIAFENFKNGKIETITIPRIELFERLRDINYSNNNQINLRFWLTSKSPVKSGPGVWETFGIGAEFEWMGLWLSPMRDYSIYLNNFSIFNN